MSGREGRSAPDSGRDARGDNRDPGVRLTRGTRRTLERIHRSTLDAFCSVRPSPSALASATEAERLATTPLSGLPIAVKEIIDVAGEICARGCIAFEGRIAEESAEIVRRLEALGAQVVGITRSTELAIARPTTTSNPHAASRTPGGSSSGSAAAVGGTLVPFALGSQTIGSTIRPAAYCGTVGFKPSHGIVSLDGVMPLAPTLDHLGFFADSVERLVGVTSRLDPRLSAEDGPRPPRFLFVRRWFAEPLDPAVKRGLAAVRTALDAAGFRCGDQALPSMVSAEAVLTDTILVREMAERWFDSLHGHADVSERLRDFLRRGRAVSDERYAAALDERKLIARELDAWLDERDIIVAPSVTGLPPRKEDGTGSRDPQRLWTLAGMPTLSLPFGWHGGLPLAVQLVARRGADRTLLAAASLAERLAVGARSDVR